MFKRIALGLLVVVVLFAAFVKTRPADFHIERRTTIDAPPAVVFPIVNDFRQWSRWSPWERMDPEMEKTYSTPSAGVGATYAWKGNEDVGTGRMEIVASEPARRVALRLEFEEPFPASNDVELALRKTAGGTEVVWGMDGRNDFLGKVFFLFMDMDAMIGKDFESGLAAMKLAAEADARG